MSQLEPDHSLSYSFACPIGTLPAKQHVISGPGLPPLPTNPYVCFRMVSALGKRRAAVSSNDLEAELKEQSINRRKHEEGNLSPNKFKPSPILVGQASRSSVQ